jgi:hypothetical protein
VDLVENVEEVALGVDADALDAGDDLADDLLARGSALGCSSEPRRCGSSLPWTKSKIVPGAALLQLTRCGAAGAAQSRQR